MFRLAAVVTFFFSSFLLVPGCNQSVSTDVGKKQSTSEPTQSPPAHSDTGLAAPAVRGHWSEPVNGIRMMAKLVEPASTGPGNMRTLLIFTTNVSDRPINVPPIETEWLVHRQLNGSQPMELPNTANNFRIVAEDMNKQREVHVHPDLYDELVAARQLDQAFEPGEVRVYVIYLMLDRQLMAAMQQLQEMDTVRSSGLEWTSHVGEPGEYRLHLTYRPDGFFGDDSAERDQHDDGWEDKQIVLPPITVALHDDDFRDEPIAEELNEF